MHPYKILLAGIGAVGGYFGGLLAHKYDHSEDVQVFFLARGENLIQIRNHGLKFYSGEVLLFTARPSIVSDSASDFGIVDLVLISSKAFDLESVLETIRPAVGPHTVILPLLNGVDSVERIRTLYPDTITWQGFTYLVARRTEPGVVRNIGNVQKLFFGNDTIATPAMQIVHELFLEAGIESILSQEISRLMWEKFIFISPLASLTSYLDLNRGQIMDDPQHMALLETLIDEIILLARTLKISLGDDIRDVTLHKLRSLTRDTTSSMHYDFSHGRRTELETLTGYVVRNAETLGIPTPAYAMVYAKLRKNAVGS